MITPFNEGIGSRCQETVSGYQSFNEQNTVYLRVDSIDLGSFKASSKAHLRVCIGSRREYSQQGFDFHRNERIPHQWEFEFRNADRSSFVIALYKKRVFGGDSEIGKAEIKLNDFEANAVTTKTVTLQSQQFNSVPATITISVHRDENGSPAFQAPMGKSLPMAQDNMRQQQANLFNY